MNLQRCHRDHFLLWAISCYAWDLPLRVLCFSSEMPLEKINFSFASVHQMEIVTGLEIGTCIHSLHSPRMLSGAALCTSFPLCLSLHELGHISALLDLESLVSLVMFILPGSHTLSVPFPHSFLNFGRWEITCMSECYKGSTSLHTDWLGISVFAPIYCSNGCSRISLGIILLVLFF